jgi:hypothetical protein
MAFPQSINCTSQAVPSDVSCEFHLTECEATFRVINFVAALTAANEIVTGRPDFRQIKSGHTMSAGDFKFEISVLWGMTADGQPDHSQCVGVTVGRIDDVLDDCTLCAKIAILNQSSKRDVQSNDKGFHRLPHKHTRGMVPWQPRHHHLMLHDVCDPSKGCLHEGALHVKVKLAVVIDTVGPIATNMHVSHGAGLSHVSSDELSDSFEALLESKLFADVTIQVGERTLEAHRTILAARSPVFSAMFASGMQESRGKTISINELDECAVEDMIRFLYTGRVKPDILSSDERCLNLTRAAHLYGAVKLVDICVEQISKRLTLTTVCERLTFAELMECQRLKAKCLSFISQHMTEVQSTEGYTQLSKTLLMDIIAAMSLPPPAKYRRIDQANSIS